MFLRVKYYLMPLEHIAFHLDLGKVLICRDCWNIWFAVLLACGESVSDLFSDIIPVGSATQPVVPDP
jgi:hypothetical protein